MPIYEYECPRCGEFETTQRITEEPLKRCPTCKSKVKKLISNTSFQLKGSGWYATDYARKDGGPSNGAESEKAKDKSAESEPKKEAKKDSKTDSKTAAKGDSVKAA